MRISDWSSDVCSPDLWTIGHDASALAEQLQQCGVAAAKSASSVDLVSDPHLWARGFFREVSDGEGGSRPIVGPAWTLTRGAEIRDGGPRLGEHNADRKSGGEGQGEQVRVDNGG